MPHGEERSIPRDAEIFQWSHDGSNDPSIFELGMAPWKRCKEREESSHNIVVKLKRQNRLRRLRGEDITSFDHLWTSYAIPTKKSTLTQEQKAWPIHAKDLTPVSPSLIAELRDPIFSFLSDEKRYAELRNCSSCSFPSSKLSQEDVAVLKKRNIIEDISLDDIPTGCVGIVFSVAEESKTRRRLVHDTLTPNVEISTDPSVAFTPIPALLNHVNHYSYGCTFDFSSFYYQFELAQEVRKYFAFRVGDQYFCMKRLPMGFKLAAKMAQLASQFLSQNPYHVHISKYLFLRGSSQLEPIGSKNTKWYIW